MDMLLAGLGEDQDEPLTSARDLGAFRHRHTGIEKVAATAGSGTKPTFPRREGMSASTEVGGAHRGLERAEGVLDGGSADAVWSKN